MQHLLLMRLYSVLNFVWECIQRKMVHEKTFVLNAAGMMPGVQPPSQQATRHARRVYVGGLPPTGNEQNIATFFSNALAAIGGTTAGPG